MMLTPCLHGQFFKDIRLMQEKPVGFIFKIGVESAS